jgi:hypothetical protein
MIFRRVKEEQEAEVANQSNQASGGTSAAQAISLSGTGHVCMYTGTIALVAICGE